jgi:putative SOS response-associated peptidase YedK
LPAQEYFPALETVNLYTLHVGSLQPMPGFPDYPAPVIRNTQAGTEMTLMRRGMPPPPRTGGPPVTNILKTSSPHWRRWLKAENRCLVPFTASLK